MPMAGRFGNRRLFPRLFEKYFDSCGFFLSLLINAGYFVNVIQSPLAGASKTTFGAKAPLNRVPSFPGQGLGTRFCFMTKGSKKKWLKVQRLRVARAQFADASLLLLEHNLILEQGNAFHFQIRTLVGHKVYVDIWPSTLYTVPILVLPKDWSLLDVAKAAVALSTDNHAGRGAVESTDSEGERVGLNRASNPSVPTPDDWTPFDI